MSEQRSVGILEPTDCPECRSARSVYGDYCEVCLTDFGEHARPVRTPEEGSRALRLIDLLDQLESLTIIAAQRGHTEHLAMASKQLQEMLLELRSQFVGRLITARDRL